jgi:hypothetical protein
MDKLQELAQYSNPEVAQKNANDYFGKQTQLYISTKKDKKYMIQDPNGKWIHFGQLGFADFTLTGDKEKQRLFKLRNHKWSKQDKFTPGWLSYHLLW